MYKTFIALRYLRRNWLNLVAVGAVAMGVLVLICVLSVMKGFDQEFRARVRATLSDLIVESWLDESFGDYDELMAKIERLPHVEACAPRFTGQALVKLGSMRNSRSAEFHGIDLARELKATEFAEYWRAGRGREARDTLAAVLSVHDASLSDVAKEDVVALLSRLRASDFDLLEKREQRAIETWAEQNGVSLESHFRAAEAACPEWGAVEDPKRESPAFPGAELIVLGRDEEGNSVTLPRDKPLGVFVITGSYEDPVVLRRCRIQGTFRSGLYDYDLRYLYLPLADAQFVLDKDDPPEITSINIRLDSFDNAPLVRAMLLGILTPEEMAEGLVLIRPYLRESDEKAAAYLEAQVDLLRRRAAGWFAEGNPRVVNVSSATQNLLAALMAEVVGRLGDDKSKEKNAKAIRAFREKLISRVRNGVCRQFQVSTWEDKRRTFLRAIWLERRIMGIILFFVTLVAGFLVLSILHTTVVAKTKDIGILKSIGGSVGGIMSIFLLNGLLIGVIGAALGTAGGLLITKNINEIEGFLNRTLNFKVFPTEIYYLDKLPVDKDPFLSTVAISVTAIVMSFLASAYPAWKASRMDPVEALRHE